MTTTKSPAARWEPVKPNKAVTITALGSLHDDCDSKAEAKLFSLAHTSITQMILHECNDDLEAIADRFCLGPDYLRPLVAAG